ncbi:hypothetical protein ACFWN1_13010 [Streptomyces sp. NPDC058459]|uniref:hypothetical protein n=1 Tax=Streptomyces sp. NPDC058459 TaxID=3346508 RepID=UPI00365C44E7
MQQSAVPELARTDTRPIHWVATATAVAGVIALSSLVQPGPATAAQPTATEARPAPTATTPPGTDGVAFPLDCGPVEAVVAHQAHGDLDGDGRPETVAAVHCDAPMGTPPDALYVLTRDATTGKPRVVATLVRPADRITVTDLGLSARTVTATLLGYSTDDIPSCCPDVRKPASWRWNGHAFLRSTPADTRGV